MTMNKTLSDMKNSLDERMKEKIALEEERDYLKETVGRLQGQLNHTQAEVWCSVSTQTNHHSVDCKPVLCLYGYYVDCRWFYLMYDLNGGYIWNKTEIKLKQNILFQFYFSFISDVTTALGVSF